MTFKTFIGMLFVGQCFFCSSIVKQSVKEATLQHLRLAASLINLVVASTLK
jgi:hypothetical protein